MGTQEGVPHGHGSPPPSGPGPQYSPLAGRAGGSASMGSAVRFGLLSAAVALLHRQNSERKVRFGEERRQAGRQAAFLHAHQRMRGLLIYFYSEKKRYFIGLTGWEVLHIALKITHSERSVSLKS